jgi:hypothetical protein
MATAHLHRDAARAGTDVEQGTTGRVQPGRHVRQFGEARREDVPDHHDRATAPPPPDQLGVALGPAGRRPRRVPCRARQQLAGEAADHSDRYPGGQRRTQLVGRPKRVEAQPAGLYQQGLARHRKRIVLGCWRLEQAVGSKTADGREDHRVPVEFVNGVRHAGDHGRPRRPPQEPAQTTDSRRSSR